MAQNFADQLLPPWLLYLRRGHCAAYWLNKGAEFLFKPLEDLGRIFFRNRSANPWYIYMRGALAEGVGCGSWCERTEGWRCGRVSARVLGATGDGGRVGGGEAASERLRVGGGWWLQR